MAAAGNCFANAGILCTGTRQALGGLKERHHHRLISASNFSGGENAVLSRVGDLETQLGTVSAEVREVGKKVDTIGKKVDMLLSRK